MCEGEEGVLGKVLSVGEEGVGGERMKDEDERKEVFDFIELGE